MTDATVLTLKHWGNSLGVRLPAAIARAARLHADQHAVAFETRFRLINWLLNG